MVLLTIRRWLLAVEHLSIVELSVIDMHNIERTLDMRNNDPHSY